MTAFALGHRCVQDPALASTKHATEDWKAIFVHRFARVSLVKIAAGNKPAAQALPDLLHKLYPDIRLPARYYHTPWAPKLLLRQASDLVRAFFVCVSVFFIDICRITFLQSE